MDGSCWFDRGWSPGAIYSHEVGGGRRGDLRSVGRILISGFVGPLNLMVGFLLGLNVVRGGMAV